MDIVSYVKINRDEFKALLVFILISVLSFSSGYYYRAENYQGGDVIIKESNEDCSRFFNYDISEEGEGKVAGSYLNIEDVNKEVIEDSQSDIQIKAFAASKNSTIYHRADCPYVDRIKDENIIWFSSQQEAEAQGFKSHSCVE